MRAAVPSMRANVSHRSRSPPFSVSLGEDSRSPRAKGTIRGTGVTLARASSRNCLLFIVPGIVRPTTLALEARGEPVPACSTTVVRRPAPARRRRISRELAQSPPTATLRPLRHCLPLLASLPARNGFRLRFPPGSLGHKVSGSSTWSFQCTGTGAETDGPWPLPPSGAPIH